MLQVERLQSWVGWTAGVDARFGLRHIGLVGLGWHSQKVLHLAECKEKLQAVGNAADDNNYITYKDSSVRSEAVCTHTDNTKGDFSDSRLTVRSRQPQADQAKLHATHIEENKRIQ